ncbi:MAG: hypothetical protein H5T71_10895 [Chloroflexi bacterium]|nr:hypothetical protein [Chloroflexota bacterium]
MDPKLIFDAIKYVGAEKCVIATDFGQLYNPPPAEGMRLFIVILRRMGMSEKEIYTMAIKNPAKLLDIEL